MCGVMWRLLCRCLTHGYLLHFFLLFLLLLQCANGSGFFELQVLEMANPRSELTTGQCCGGAVRNPLTSRCTTPCNTFFRLCLKEYQSNVTSTGTCSFGNTSSSVLGQSSFTLADPERGKLVLPFSFRWTRSFTLILQAVDHNNFTSPGTQEIIDEATYSGIIDPSAEWHTLNHRGPRASLTYRVRVKCDTHYYNATCTKFCRPRDDKFGHYICDANGDKECIDGWKGATCDVAVCKPGCHPLHGKCDNPGECNCRPGWRGDFCDQCEPYPGCKHGYCNGSSWQCICDTNWGGILCDQDLNYCGTHEPCMSGGTCENTAPDKYMCTCPDGFSGINCETVDNPCAPAPCLHGGTCLEEGGSFSCECAPGWTGPTCNIDIDECASAPCQNGGTCVNLEDSFKCDCPPAWEGNVCQFDADECLAHPCINAFSCTNLVGDYLCKCRVGWMGKNCDQNINDCVGQCQHGATCIDLVNDYHCACQPGYTGRDCATDINDCASNPCKNGGECDDLVNGYRCICPVGFTGHECENDYDHCSPDPCQNGASCFNTQQDYYCHCPEGWQGKNCSQPRLLCDNPPCTDIGNCDGICGDHGRCVSLTGIGHSCQCEPGYTGKYCHENINDCKINPCENGGTCVDKVNAFQCICKEGWEGALCNINTDECNPNPCRNNGTCIDGIADFECECKNGWKGKTCSSRDSHCDHNTCKNGGTCQDLGNTFVCRCLSDWEGTMCHISKQAACRSSPCLNGGTCVNTDDYYRCICRDGFQGNHCQDDVNDCQPQPCYNGGKCIDGVNWFLCECAAGFTGPDCRININECASNPCDYGGTCIDEIGDYRCICPPGRHGKRCNLDNISYLPSPGSCLWGGQNLDNNMTWQHECNTCICNNGIVKCTKIWCGLSNCRNSHPTTICNLNQVCVPSSAESCLSPPCQAHGECRDLEGGRRVKPPQLPSPPSCWPNQATLSNTCARLTLLFDRMKLPAGVTVEGICLDLRRLLATQQAASGLQEELILLCDLKLDYNDTIEVTLFGDKGVLDGIRVIGEAISRKQTSLLALTSIVEVKVETALVSEEKPSNKYLIVLICFILIAIGAAVVLSLLYLRHKKKSLGMSGVNLSPSADSCHRNHEDEKSNNLQNEENLRRYTNPLKDDIGSMGSINSTGACGMDMPKVSVVRPLSSMIPMESSSEMLEMISEVDCPGSRKTMLVMPGTSSDTNSLKGYNLNESIKGDGLSPAHRSSQIMLYKAQNPDVRKNTAAFDDSSGHKDFSKSIINVNKQRTSQNTSQNSSDVLTVLV
ncbi:protein jagged-1b isoform X2 [Coccinella septempunctata]|uniref:protein jagged-1b isoform X2 n=1 Tax=Coccinella septempunctata TaxID=41139 RepID=UPI001D08385F|nr:protein jagged-1b isoform X2 [Coccinella septempunctata]